MSSLLKAIGVGQLTAYFEYLDASSSSVYPVLWLRNAYPGMTRIEAIAVVGAWRGTVNETLPAEDRACNALETECA